MAYGSPAALKWDRRRMSVRMCARMAVWWLVAASSVWISSGAALVYGLVGPVGRAYYSTWALSWLLSEVVWLPFLRVSYQGGSYRAVDVYVTLTDSLYGRGFGQWLLVVSPFSTLLAAGCLVGLTTWAKRREHAERAEGEHVRGIRLVMGRSLERALRGDGITLGGVALPRELETQHAVITGSTGTGKSTQLRSLLKEIAARGEVAIVVDPEREFVAEFLDEGRGDVVLNPVDARCPYWSPWLELSDESRETDAEALAKSLLPDAPNGRASGSDQYFRECARQVFVGLLSKLEEREPVAIPRSLALPHAALKKLLAGTPAEVLIDPDVQGQSSGITSTLQTAASAFRFLPSARGESWSAREWVKRERRGWLFLTFAEASREAVLPLTTLWLDTLIRHLLDVDPAASGERRVWLVVDELAALKRLHHLEDILVRGRKRGVSVVLGFQAITQLRDLYGRDRASTLLAAPATKLILRVSEPETATWCSEAIGKREVIRAESSAMTGVREGRDSFSMQRRRTVEQLVLASEIAALPSLSGFLSIAGHDVARVQFDYEAAKSIASPFVPRPLALVLPTVPPPATEPAQRELPIPTKTERTEEDRPPTRARRL